MSVVAGDLDLLADPLAVELLGSRLPARLAYLWTDETPRVVPVWFHWTGSALVIGSPARAPKLDALERHPEVAVTIDSDAWPYRVLSVRGTAVVTRLDDVVPEYAAAAERYLGPDAGQAWVASLRGQPMGRVEITPRWANLLDFEHRFPSALSA
ncbi:pyridoxamine 5'-phosphate oxidase family protein [Microlunatus flavus]|uniref:Pyridoxamine 5'-phosphate oxidase n=1 Tax=Microlunatus flavus TaxID=1036181 RepID=A0A1H9CAJ7_9ACTN|nr:pyridoxamine 5'-phosphate oxidase family protein [Microlunatus flavus]SEP98260.1 Pyridoxamine 5'-phosphate oxidase [Microlunatus flavus]